MTIGKCVSYEASVKRRVGTSAKISFSSSPRRRGSFNLLFLKDSRFRGNDGFCVKGVFAELPIVIHDKNRTPRCRCERPEATECIIFIRNHYITEAPVSISKNNSKAFVSAPAEVCQVFTEKLLSCVRIIQRMRVDFCPVVKKDWGQSRHEEGPGVLVKLLYVSE